MATVETPTVEQTKQATWLDSLIQIDGYYEVGWETFTNIEFDIRYTEELGGDVPFPIWTEELLALNNQLIQVEGYVIPMEETGDASVIFLSAYPYTQCFFCGAAGPESVIDILSEKPIKDLVMDEKMSFRGRLVLNDTDFDYLNYILEDAEVLR